MRVNHIIIKKSGILKNIDTPCSQINLIIGDNERGKTTLLDWVARGVFEKPATNSEYQWSTTIDYTSNIQFDLQSVYYQYDSNRMRNLLTFHETDLLFKYKNQEELHKQEYWNTELNSLLYGNDEISLSLQNNFSHAMGVDQKNKKNSWLIQLHNGLFDLKNTLEDLLPEVEYIQSKSYGIQKLNQSLGELSHSEQEFQQKKDLYFTMEKIQAATTYLKVAAKKEKSDNAILEIEHLLETQNHLKSELIQKDDSTLDYDDIISDLKLSIHQKEQKAQQIATEPFEVYQKGLGKTIFQACLGITFIILGLTFAFQSISSIEINFIKAVSLFCFMSGSFFLIKSGAKSIALQNLTQSSEENPNAIHKVLIQKAQKEVQNTYKQLEKKQEELQTLRDNIAQIRKELKNIELKLETCKKLQREGELFQKEFTEQQQIIMHLFYTDDPVFIQQQVDLFHHQIKEHNSNLNFNAFQQMRQNKTELLQQKTDISEEYSSSKHQISKRIKGLIDDLQNNTNRNAVQHFYPEIFELYMKTNDISNYTQLLEIVDFLINKVSNDRYRAEKLVSFFNHIESNTSSLLSKILNTNFFVYLTQNIFGGKYQRFITKNIPQEGTKIFAETGTGELFPLESLSSVTYSQFWFILKMALAKSIIKDQDGILILDDPFTSFDTIRKQYFLDAINALVHQGWQIFISITNDPQIEEYCSSMFSSVLTVINLNQD